MQQVGYPAQFTVDHPDRPLGRLNTALRIFVVIPILIVLAAVSGYVAYLMPSQTYGITYPG